MRRNINKKSQKRLVHALNRQFTELAQLQRFATAIVATYLATTDSLASATPRILDRSGIGLGDPDLVDPRPSRRPSRRVGHEPAARDRRDFDLRPVHRSASGRTTW